MRCCDRFALDCVEAALSGIDDDPKGMAINIVAGSLLGTAEAIRRDNMHSDDMSVIRRAKERSDAYRQRAAAVRKETD